MYAENDQRTLKTVPLAQVSHSIRQSFISYLPSCCHCTFAFTGSSPPFLPGLPFTTFSAWMRCTCRECVCDRWLYQCTRVRPPASRSHSATMRYAHAVMARAALFY